jgi:hypothetical protein
MLIFAAFGNMYSGLLFVLDAWVELDKAIFIYVYLVIAPLCIYVPIYLYSNSNVALGLLSFTYGSVVLFCLGSCLCSNMPWCREDNSRDQNRDQQNYPANNPTVPAPMPSYTANTYNDLEQNYVPSAVYYSEASAPPLPEIPVAQVIKDQNQSDQNQSDQNQTDQLKDQDQLNVSKELVMF